MINYNTLNYNSRGYLELCYKIIRRYGLTCIKIKKLA